MTSFSQQKAVVNVLFFRNAAAIYGSGGLAPATPNAAGADLRACLPDDEELFIPPGERRGVGSGVAIELLEPGFAGFVFSRSGLGAVKGITVAQGVGLIDPDYRGEIMVYLLNTSADGYTVRQGERIAQLVFLPYLQAGFRPVPSLGETERGAGGFGHTGRQ